ncbi:hypothetical protein Bpfe_000501 [Biomphalaria pfeifferi]|uniref:Uncharacterized protein n=1 Tax=Biomphalaria pfeifferi TaxID=112525 RepID=A0AAD8FP38_BIOPF|nr:hypothetical protein Bpfe_000501 [Biomphalaria pfeifferi]
MGGERIDMTINGSLVSCCHVCVYSSTTTTSRPVFTLSYRSPRIRFIVPRLELTPRSKGRHQAQSARRCSQSLRTVADGSRRIQSLRTVADGSRRIQSLRTVADGSH